MTLSLQDKKVLVTGGARRVGRLLSLACARAGADVIIHHSNSAEVAQKTCAEINKLGRQAWIRQCDFTQSEQVEGMLEQATQSIGPIYAVVNSACIFDGMSLKETSLQDWERHLRINLTAPFLLCRAFARLGGEGRIVNILDWRALRPGADHFPYTVTKAALAAMTQSVAQEVAPRITVNGLALGAVLPPSDGDGVRQNGIVENVPAARWCDEDEVGQALLFLLTGPTYITGTIIPLDGGRHMV